MAIELRIDDPRRDVIAELLTAHLDDMFAVTPPESVHALSIDELCRPEVTFWSACEGTELLGCAALSELSPEHGEIKSVRTVIGHRRNGVASCLLRHLISEAEGRRYSRLSLETGAMEAFAPARALFGRFGFVACGPFANYRPDPNSVFMTLDLRT